METLEQELLGNVKSSGKQCDKLDHSREKMVLINLTLDSTTWTVKKVSSKRIERVFEGFY